MNNAIFYAVGIAEQIASSKSTVTVSAIGTSTETVGYITIDGIEKKIQGEKYTAGQGILISDDNVISTVQAEPVWGSITGQISNQTDLIALLDQKQSLIEDLDSIRTGALAGLTAYQKPITGIPTADLADGDKLDSISFGATKVEAVSKSGMISIDDVEIQIVPDGLVIDDDYKHIIVTSSSVSDGINTFNQYDDTEIINRILEIDEKIIESIKIENAQTDLPILNKKVILPIATFSTAGMTKADEDSLTINNLGEMSVKAVDVKTLYVAEDEELILSDNHI